MAFVLKAFETLFNLEVEKRNQYKICIYARVRNGEGNYWWNCLQYPALYFDAQGNLLFGLVLYTNVNHLMSSHSEPMLTIMDSTDKSNQTTTLLSEIVQTLYFFGRFCNIFSKF
jgi:hypothetical protein